MIEYSFQHGRLQLRVQVVPRASRSEIVGEHNGALRVRIAAPPVDGAANEELVRTLAKTFEVPRSAVSIIGGQNGRRKQVCIEGVERNDTVRKLLGHR
ncbi:MAG TPA: DUF167 domain-containing protein [Pyrinomonadaceae bacterium]|nr:DUF167 domain-containing protein [Pyrinomonadaceae bacterium]